MNCKTCRKPIHLAADGTWSHDGLNDMLICPAGTVEPAMFNMLTKNELFQLHRSLHSASHAIYNQMMTADGHPRIEVCGPEWNILSAHSAEIGEMAAEAHAEVLLREAEYAGA